MNDLFGPFEKLIVAVLVFLFSIYYVLDRYVPSIIYSELNNVHNDFSVSSHMAPRKGVVVPAGEYSRYLSNPESFLPNEFSQPQNSQYDPAKINWFAKGTDGEKHPSNAFLVNFAPFETKKYWLPLLALSLRVKYLRDDDIKIDDDTWQTSPETYLRMAGDCEDHAILLADWMINLGYDARVVAGIVHKEAHAWVVLYKDGKEYLLETTDKASRRRYPLVSLHPEYSPAFMFNRDHFWVMTRDNRGWRNRLSTQSWVELSDFKESL